jgi:hypothetical protein
MVAVTHAPSAAGAAQPVLPDKQMMIEAVKLLHPGRVVELRLLNLDGRGGTASGYFDQPALLAGSALRYSRRAEGVYITLNPVPASLLSRENNRVQERAKRTTTDDEVLRRVWFPIDLDPTRPSGISASEHEHQAALEQARRVREWLSSEWGWHAPIFADSGNGAHLLYAIDLPNDAASTDLLKRCLAALARRFDRAPSGGTEAVKLDQSVYNAARIWKLYGSVARKGEHLPERPHRLAQIISAPDPVELVTRAQLEGLAAMTTSPPANEFAPHGLRPPSPPVRTPPSTGEPADQEGARGTRVGGFGGGTPLGAVSTAGGRGGRVTEEDLLAWLERHGVEVRRAKPGDRGTIYVLERCPFAEHHEAGKACVTLGETGALGFHCFAGGCAGYGWQDLKALWGDGPLAPAAGQAVPLDVEPGDEPPADEEEQARALETARPWPEALAEEAYYGLAGEMVRALEPHTEADPVALLAHLLTAFGCAVGRGPHLLVGATRHEPRLFTVVVGQSANARKGDAWASVRAILLATPEPPRIQTSLSSGEGLVRLVCDEVSELRPVKGAKGQQPTYEKVIILAGETDKRLLVVTSEMAGLFQVMRRDGNTLSAIIRDGWDHGDLAVATRNDPLRATGAYLSIVGHITQDELRHELTDLHAANGFGNRFCWFAVKRSQELPVPEMMTSERLQPLAARLTQAIERARRVGLMRYGPDMDAAWRENYHALSRARWGFTGALLSRAPAQVLRIAMLYALLDGSAVINGEHLKAAGALWAYAGRSVAYLFGARSGDGLADKIEAALREHGEQTRTELRASIGHNNRDEDIRRALEALASLGKIARVMGTPGAKGGRPAERWRTVHS